MIIEIENLEKSFKEVKAVDGVSFKVKEGELFAFLGINGAGKSTTINIICGTLKKDGGTVKVCGYDIDENSDSIKGNIGIVFQNSVLDKKLSVYDNLKSRAGLYGIFGKEFKARLEQISNLLDLKEILKRPISKLSGGQKRRIDIARALLHNPKLLILDEPTTGLHMHEVGKLITVLHQLVAKGATVVVIEHNTDIILASDYVVDLGPGGGDSGGYIVSAGTPEAIMADPASVTGRFLVEERRQRRRQSMLNKKGRADLSPE